MEYEAIGTWVEANGIQAIHFGHSCKCHVTCGSVLHIDALARIKWTQIEYGNTIFCCCFVKSYTQQSISDLQMLTKEQPKLVSIGSLEGWIGALLEFCQTSIWHKRMR